jgi:hypothetical protein
MYEAKLDEIAKGFPHPVLGDPESRCHVSLGKIHLLGKIFAMPGENSVQRDTVCPESGTVFVDDLVINKEPTWFSLISDDELFRGRHPRSK